MRHRIGNTAVLAAGYHLAFAIGTGLAVAAIIVDGMAPVRDV